MLAQKHQQGFTFLGFLLICAAVIFSAFLLFRLGPSYLQFYTISQSLNEIAETPVDPGALSEVTEGIRQKLLRHLEVNSADILKDGDVKVTSVKSGYQVNVAYDVQKPLFLNIDVVLHFNKSVVVPKK